MCRYPLSEAKRDLQVIRLHLCRGPLPSRPGSKGAAQTAGGVVPPRKWRTKEAQADNRKGLGNNNHRSFQEYYCRTWNNHMARQEQLNVDANEENHGTTTNHIQQQASSQSPSDAFKKGSDMECHRRPKQGTRIFIRKQGNWWVERTSTKPPWRGSAPAASTSS